VSSGLSLQSLTPQGVTNADPKIICDTSAISASRDGRRKDGRKRMKKELEEPKNLSDQPLEEEQQDHSGHSRARIFSIDTEQGLQSLIQEVGNGPMKEHLQHILENYTSERDYFRTRASKAEELCERQRQDIECLESAHRIAKKSLDDDSAKELTNVNGYLREIGELQEQVETLKRIRLARKERDGNRQQGRQAVFDKFPILIDRMQPALNASRLAEFCSWPVIDSDTLIFSLLTRIFGDCGAERLKEHVNIMLETRATTVPLLHALLAAAVCFWALESPFYELTRASGPLLDEYKTLIKQQGAFDASKWPGYSY
jgi:hypothetical protein